MWYPADMRSRIAPLVLLVSAPILVSLPCSGCSAKKRAAATVAREVVAQPDEDDSAEEAQPRFVSGTPEMSTDQMGSFCSGALGCTLQGIGWALALPFRVLVGFFDALF